MAKIYEHSPSPPRTSKRYHRSLASVRSLCSAQLRKIKPSRRSEKVKFNGVEFAASELFSTYFQFVAERHQIFLRRHDGQSQPWTDDSILAAYPFTNVFRVLDRNSQYILQNVIQKGSQDLHEAFFRVLLFRTFNKIETWEFLEESLGTITWKDFNLQKYDRVLSSVDGAVYNSVYIMPAPGRAFGFDRNYLNHLRLIDLMMAEKLADELQQMKHLKDAHGRVCLYPSMGEFTAMQLILDLNMMPHFNWSEDEWVAVGPGSKSCLHKMFGSDVAGHEEAAMRFIRDEQFKYFNKYGVDTVEIPRLCPERRPGLTMVDIEHSLCECEKYSRARFPELKGKRVRVGLPYVAKDLPVTLVIPTNWLTCPLSSPQYSQPPPLDDNDTYEVSHIVKEKDTGRYIVRWLGWGPTDDTVVSEANLSEGSMELVAQWKKMKQKIADGIEKRCKQDREIRTQ